MKISYDGTTVSFNTEPEELFLAEKSGDKSNTVRILDYDEYLQLKKDNPKRIIIQHQHEIFLRTITHIYVTEDVLGKVIVVFSWAHNKHYHNLSVSEQTDPKDTLAHTMSLHEDLPTPPHEHIMPPTDDAFTVVNVSRNLHRLLQSIAHGRSMNSVIQELYETSQYQEFKAETALATEEAEEDKKLALIGISKGLSNILVRLTYNRSMDTVIRELYQIYLDKQVEEGAALRPPIQTVGVEDEC